MSTESTNSPPPRPQPTDIRVERNGRTLSKITKIHTREKGYVFARSVEQASFDEEYFVHVTQVPSDLWERLVVGDIISSKITTTGKGAKAVDVRLAEDGELDRVATQEENRGNR